MADEPQGRRGSYWIATGPETGFAALAGGAGVDVAIIGGGIVGLTAAIYLKRGGRSVAVIDSGRVAARVSGATTAKVTSQHGLKYAGLIRSHGEEVARAYADANQAAIGLIAELIAELGIDCGFQRTSAYVYTETRERTEAIEAEAEAAHRLGLPAAMVTQCPLPYRIAAAVRFEDQAQFHPRRYLVPLAQAIPGDGCHVFEDTRVLDVQEDTPCRVITDRGTVTAGDVIVATNLPILNRGAFFAKAYPRCHVMLAASINGDKLPDGMFISVDTPSRSVRGYRPDGGPAVLIAVGEAFKAGENATRLHRELEAFVRSHFSIREVEWRWQNQDYYSMDGRPFVGRITPWSDHIHIATGFGAWGMTNGTVAARILANSILEQPNPWARAFDSNRVDIAPSARSFLLENAHVARHWVEERLAVPRLRSVADLARGEGAVARINGHTLAIHKDEHGVLHAFSPVCTHLGCHVSWNSAEKTWDCGCHGSRFSADGKVVNGPAVKDLRRKRVPM